MGKRKYTTCCRCRNKLVVRHGFAERCKCLGEIGVIEATSKIKNWLIRSNIKEYSLGNMTSGRGQKQNIKNCKSSLGIRKSLTKK